MSVNSSSAIADETPVPSRTSVLEHAVPLAPAFEFIPRSLTYRCAGDVAYPQDGELLLWRFRPEWHLVSKDEAYARLSKAELARVKSHPNPALGKRFAVGRAVMREILAEMLGCAPGEVELSEDERGQLRLAQDDARQPVEIAIAYAGIWIVIGVSTTSVGLATRVPTLPDNAADGHADASNAPRRMRLNGSSVEMRSRVRHDSLTSGAGRPLLNADACVLQQDSASFVIDTVGAMRWHILDLPMPGTICAAAAVAQPLTRVLAFGWAGRDGRAIAGRASTADF
ncbi:hypothetical protein [Paraburkholderia sp. BCC1885]|uniref:hypothetical protein n=1 Tax=Paraburkholderia sp. BCC1885 TaxID=2562669 RepID=UPI001181D758|nr:hypothetical protein [Paraburkholderia sp. BCC1885]